MKRSILPMWLTVSLTVGFVVTGVLVSALMFMTAEAVLSRPLNPVAAAAQEVADVSLPPLDQSGLAVPPTLEPGQPTPTPIPTSDLPPLDPDRVTILLLGIDRRPGEPFISRTDTMMLMSINPSNQTASILSVPRDLYVVIPGHGRDRINTAFVYGSRGNNPSGGAALTMQTVEYNLGVPIDHYIMVDFSAVIGSIDAIGGIEVDVPFNINDPTYPDMNYGYDPLFIPAGRQHMDGELALKYARTRHVDNDFGRAQRQQQVLLTVRGKVLSMGLGELLKQAPTLYANLKSGIGTDMSLEQMMQLAWAVNDIPTENIRNEVLDYDYVSSYTTERGASVLILSNEKAAPLIAELFYDE